MQTNREYWDLIIQPRSNIFKLGLKKIWNYRDLLFLFVKRDFIALYKQTILGPIWFVLQPILTTITFLIVFGNIAKIPTDGMPPVLFYLSGIILWNYYAECLTKTSDTFIVNANIFGKVYFPRLIVPLSVVFSNLIRFIIQFILFLFVWFYFYLQGADIKVNYTIALVPILVLLMAGHGLGLGVIISSLTTKYRDLRFLIQFAVQLLMYASPVVYPLSSVPEKYHWILLLNPMTSIIETFKYSFLGVGVFNIYHLLFNFISFLIILFLGILLFNKVEKNFMDTV
jgi:lipopolysaccharide transport system permease protein